MGRTYYNVEDKTLKKIIKTMEVSEKIEYLKN